MGLAFDAGGSLWATGGTFRKGPGYIWKNPPSPSCCFQETSIRRSPNSMRRVISGDSGINPVNSA
jgi:hypothetical protein